MSAKGTPSLAADLRSRFPTVEVVECALAEEPGSATFYWAVDDPGWSGLQPQEHMDRLEVREISVNLRPLDDVVEDPVAVDFIKIDVRCS